MTDAHHQSPLLDLLGSIDSTSSQAHRLISSDAESITEHRLIVAATQTAGRGQLTRTWASPEGGLWCTLIWPTKADRAVLEGLGLRIGVACTKTIESVVGSRGVVQLKWPNDVYLNNKKVLGVLTEIVRSPGVDGRPFILVGVGVNANFTTSELPPEIAARATTLRDELHEDVDLARLRETLVRELTAALTSGGAPDDVLSYARGHLHSLGELVEMRVNDAPTTGVLIGLGADGLPRLRTTNGIVTAQAVIQG